MKRTKPRSNYASMKAERVERGIWRHYDTISGWERFRVFTTVDGAMIQKYFEGLGQARAFLASLKRAKRERWPGYNKAKNPDHNGNPLPRGVQNVRCTARGGRYVTYRYVASYSRNHEKTNRYFTYDPSEPRSADRALRAALRARRDAVRTYGAPLL